MLVATKAKPNQDPQSPLNREFFISFLEVINPSKSSFSQSIFFFFLKVFDKMSTLFQLVLQVLNNPKQKGRFNLTTQFPFYKEVTYKPEFGNKKLGKPVVFDMDMSAGDFVALFYLLKVPIQVINLKVIFCFFFSFCNLTSLVARNY